MAFDHLPEFGLRRQLAESLDGPSAEPVSVAQAPIRRGCITASLVLLALGAVALVALAVFVVVYIIRNQPPDLPNFARPAGARQIMNEIESCEMTDDFGPYYRQLAFESDRPWTDIRDEITGKFAARGWTKVAWNDDGFSEYAPSGNLRIRYETGDSAWFPLARHRKTARLPTTIAVTVSDCPGP